MTDPLPDPAVVAALRAAGCVFAEEEAGLLAASASGRRELDGLVARRVSGIPLEHLLGRVEFGGLWLAVEAGVFVPRRRTEALVHEAAALVRARGVPPVVADVCCGAGALGAALAAALRRCGPEPSALHATEIDPVAVGCARRNLEAWGGTVHAGDLDRPLPGKLRGRVDVLLANVPYVPTGAIATMPPEARDHEPRRALDGGPDGLDVARRLVAAAPGWLAPGGSLLIESGERQAPTLAGVMASHGLEPRTVVDDELDATVVVGLLRTGGDGVPGAAGRRP